MTTDGRHSGGSKKGLSFGEKLELALEWRELTDVGLRDLLGTARHRISRWRNGVGLPSPEQLMVICNYLSVPLEYFCDAKVTHPSQAIAWTADRGTDQEIAIAQLIRALGVDRALARLSGAEDRPEYHRVVRSRQVENGGRDGWDHEPKVQGKAGRPRGSGPKLS